MLLRNYSLTSCCRRFALTLLSAGLVLSLAAGSAHAAAKKELVDLNTATQQQLEAVKGVGAATAKKIMENGPYKSLDELTKAGLSAKKIEALKSYLMVGKTPAAPAPPAAPTAPRNGRVGRTLCFERGRRDTLQPPPAHGYERWGTYGTTITRLSG